MADNVVRQLVLPLSTADALRDRAARDGVSMSAVARDALDAWLGADADDGLLLTFAVVTDPSSRHDGRVFRVYWAGLAPDPVRGEVTWAVRGRYADGVAGFYRFDGEWRPAPDPPNADEWPEDGGDLDAVPGPPPGWPGGLAR